MITYASNLANTTWLDLLRLLKDEQAVEFNGAPFLRQLNGKSYWYVTERIGTQVHNRYIGEDTPELRSRLAQADLLRAAAKEREATRARLVRLLREHGYRSADMQTGALLSAMAKVGVFRLGGTLVGTQAFQLYEGALGVYFSAGAAATTDDVDIASFERLSLVLDDHVIEDLPQQFSKLKFEPIPSLERGKVWRWAQSRHGMMVEFLTPSFAEDEGLRDLPALGVQAQSLHYLNYLIAEPIKVPLLYRAGILVQIPQPARFAIHKLIIADRRRGEGIEARLKAQKDLSQAQILIECLRETAPFDLKDAFEDAKSRGNRWKERLEASLSRTPQIAKMLAD